MYLFQKYFGQLLQFVVIKLDVVLFHLDMTPGDLIFVAWAEKSEDKAVPTLGVTISLLQLSDFCQLPLKLSAFVSMVSYRRGEGGGVGRGMGLAVAAHTYNSCFILAPVPKVYF